MNLPSRSKALKSNVKQILITSIDKGINRELIIKEKVLDVLDIRSTT